MSPHARPTIQTSPDIKASGDCAIKPPSHFIVELRVTSLIDCLSRHTHPRMLSVPRTWTLALPS